MNHLTKNWEISPRIDSETEQALQVFPPVLRQILFNRGHCSLAAAQRYLAASAPEGCDPFALRGMAAAVERVQMAIDRDESVAIYGDYDADGVTATALLVQTLSHLGTRVQAYIPNRFDEGYGLNLEALDALHSQDVRLVIAVDCGIRSLEEAAHATKLGLDLIIIDHHHPGGGLPDAVAVINPKQPGDTYPDKDLAGVGLAYKLAEAMSSRSTAGASDPQDYLDLVALGTVADLVPLVAENRALVRAGLQRIRQARRQGIRSLIGVAGLRPERIGASDIGFILAPRLNAAGRLDSALAAFRLLTSSDSLEAGRLALQLDNQNRERQRITREMQLQAEALAGAETTEALLLFAAHPEFNPGVVGLAAARLSERFYRPAVVVAQGDEYSRGSCRSIPEFHITAALDRCEDLLTHYGGHAAAAGFTVSTRALPELIDRLQEIARQELGNQDLAPTLQVDLELPLSDLRADLLTQLELLEPTGLGNRQPRFASRDLRVTHSRTVGRDGAHLKLTVTDGHLTFDAIAFRQGHWQDRMPERVDLLYTFETNEYNGRVSLQLNVKDLKPSGAD